MASQADIAELPAVEAPTPAHFLADLYTFNWSALNVELPLVSAAAVGVCVLGGVALGHPGGALVAGGGAFTVAFGANQRVSDSRVWPMVLATVLMAVTTLIGTVVGHRGWEMIAVSAMAAAVYGVLTVRNTGLAWVGQQASISLFVASAFPSGPRPALIRAGLILLGGSLQTLTTSVALRLLPELRTNVLAIPVSLYRSLYARRREFLHRLHELPQALPAPERRVAALYALRLMITIALATEAYRRLGIQSGYWIPMTALLVQKPAFFETLNRGVLRVAGTLAGATLATLIAAHLHLNHWTLAVLVTVFAFGCYTTIGVNYGLYTGCVTSYIVFLLSLNQAPGPELAHRRAYCTMLGAGIAILIHLDGLRRHRAVNRAVG